MSVRLSQLLMLLILARLLSPRDFGLMGIALLVLSATRRFTEIGINAALIQDVKTNVDEYLNTTWCLEIARGALIFGILFVLAPFIAGIFDEPGATDLIRVLGVSPLLYGLQNPGIVYFQKDLSFHRDFLYQSSGSLAQFAIGVGYALYSPTVWALVFATVGKSFVKFIFSYVLHGYRPWPAFQFAVARKLIDYGKWITGASIVGFVYSEGDDAFVGWFLSATALGFYQFAYRIADMPASEASGIISQITFPAYSALQGDLDEVRGALVQTTRLTAFIAFPLSFGIAAVAPSFVPAILGDEWRPMIVVMQILAMYGLLHAITRNFGAVWKALGRPDYILKTGLIRIACIALLIWPATAAWGIEGTALVVVGVYAFPMLPLDVYLSAQIVNARSRQLYAEYVYPFIAALVMFATLRYVSLVTELSALVEFLVLIPSGAVVYFAVAFLLERQFDWGIEGNLRMIANGLR